MQNFSLTFNTQFFIDFWRLLKPYWISNDKKRAYLFLGLAISCIVIEILAGVALNNWNNEFFSALQNFNKPRINNLLLHFLGILAIQVPAAGYAIYFNGQLCIRWRQWLTDYYLQNWLQTPGYYQPNKRLDNPDQRISEDLALFPMLTLEGFTLFLQSFLKLLFFGYVLWSLSGKLLIQIGHFHCNVSGYLFLVTLAYALLGTWITGLIGRKLAALDYQMQRYDADFRFLLLTLRESNQPPDKTSFKRAFCAIFNNFLAVTILKKRLTIFTKGYDTSAYIVGLFIALPLYWQGKIQIGGLMQATGAMSAVLAAFSVLISSYMLFAQWRAVAQRLIELNQVSAKKKPL